MIARAANNNAYSELISCCEDEVSFSIVDAAVTDALPSGDARLAWKNLVARYEPTTSVTLVQLKKEFTWKFTRVTNLITKWMKHVSNPLINEGIPYELVSVQSVCHHCLIVPDLKLPSIVYHILENDQWGLKFL
jgi:hypothetical protein